MKNPTVIPEAAKRLSGIHDHRIRDVRTARLPVPSSVFMDSGLAAAQRPGMTNKRVMQ
jgi:hypothetical protein